MLEQQYLYLITSDDNLINRLLLGISNSIN